MKKTITISILTIFCLALMATCLVACNFSIAGSFQTTNHTVADFDKIDIDVDISNVEIKFDDNAQYGVVCYEPKALKHSVKVENNTLYISSKADIKVVGVTKAPKVTVCLKKANLSSIIVDTDTGSITLERGFTVVDAQLDTDTGSINCSAVISNNLEASTDTGSIKATEIGDSNAVHVTTDTGKILLKDFNCTSVVADNNTGDIELSNVISESLNLTTDTGDVKLTRSDGTQGIVITTDTGDISGTIGKGKNFSTNTDTGNINVPAADGDILVILKTNTGDIDINFF